MRSLQALSVLLLPVALIAGCPSVLPPPEAVLEGTWLLETTAPTLLGPTELVFDARGKLTRISIQVTAGTEVVRRNPLATVSVDGDQVTVDANLLLLGTLNFNGTLNADETVVSGHLTTNLNLLFANIVFDNGEATLTKQP